MKLFLVCLLVFLAAASAFPFGIKRRCRHVSCYEAPCRYADCPVFPNAKCINDYCGGCNAIFFVDRKRVDCELHPTKTWE